MIALLCGLLAVCGELDWLPPAALQVFRSTSSTNLLVDGDAFNLVAVTWSPGRTPQLRANGAGASLWFGPKATNDGYPVGIVAREGAVFTSQSGRIWIKATVGGNSDWFELMTNSTLSAEVLRVAARLPGRPPVPPGVVMVGDAGNTNVPVLVLSNSPAAIDWSWPIQEVRDGRFNKEPPPVLPSPVGLPLVLLGTNVVTNTWAAHKVVHGPPPDAAGWQNAVAIWTSVPAGTNYTTNFSLGLRNGTNQLELLTIPLK